MTFHRCSSPSVRRHVCPNSVRQCKREHPTAPSLLSASYRSNSVVPYNSAISFLLLHSRASSNAKASRLYSTLLLSRLRTSSVTTESNPTVVASSWEVFLAGTAAVLASVGMICAFPSSPAAKTTTTAFLEACTPNSFEGGGNENNTCNSSSSLYATMTLASGYDGKYASRDFEQVSFERQSVNVSANHPVHAKPTTTTTTLDGTASRPYDVSVRAMKGGRVTMEDEYFVAEGGKFVAVFDGHGGGGVSQFLKHHLYDAICHNLRENYQPHTTTTTTTTTILAAKENMSLPTDNNQGNTDRFAFKSEDRSDKRSVSSSVSLHAAALKAAFSEMEASVLADDSLSYQGSTAVAVFLHECSNGHRTLLSANVGDSRAVLSRNGVALDLTRDHKPNEEREKARIMAMGELIEWDRLSKVHRVRNLSLSRAIGDRFAKPVVSGEVEINHFPIVDDGDEFVVLASDGLWDAMTSEEAIRFVHDTLSKELTRENIARDDVQNLKLVLRRNMAKFLAREAIRRGSCDNVCVILVWLNETKNSSHVELGTQ